MAAIPSSSTAEISVTFRCWLSHIVCKTHSLFNVSYPFTFQDRRKWKSKKIIPNIITIGQKNEMVMAKTEVEVEQNDELLYTLR